MTWIDPTTALLVISIIGWVSSAIAWPLAIALRAELAAARKTEKGAMPSMSTKTVTLTLNDEQQELLKKWLKDETERAVWALSDPWDPPGYVKTIQDLRDEIRKVTGMLDTIEGFQMQVLEQLKGKG